MAEPMNYKSLIAPVMVMLGTGLGVAISSGTGAGLLGTLFAAILGGGGMMALAFGVQKMMGEQVDVKKTSLADVEQMGDKAQTKSHLIVVANSGLDTSSRVTLAATTAQENSEKLLDIIDQADNLEEAKRPKPLASRHTLIEKMDQYNKFVSTIDAPPLPNTIGDKQLSQATNHSFYSQLESSVTNRMTAIVAELKETLGKSTKPYRNRFQDAEFVDRSITQGLLAFQKGNYEEMDRIAYGANSEHKTVRSSVVDTPISVLGGSVLMHPIRHAQSALSLGGVEAIPVFGLQGYASTQDTSIDKNVSNHASLFLELNELCKVHRELVASKMECAEKSLVELKAAQTPSLQPAPPPESNPSTTAPTPAPADPATASLPQEVRDMARAELEQVKEGTGSSVPYGKAALPSEPQRSMLS
jgi:hypothetical protein